jgi:hypothetical protein
MALVGVSWMVAPTAQAVTRHQLISETSSVYYSEFPAGTYVIYSTLSPSRKVVDVGGGSLQSGANIQLYDYNGSGAQKFYISYNSYSALGGRYTIKNTQSSKYVDVKYGGTANGTNVWQYSWNGSAAQLWLIHRGRHSCTNGGKPVVLESFVGSSEQGAGLVLDVSGGKTQNGTNIQVYSWNNSNAQKFCLVRI